MKNNLELLGRKITTLNKLIYRNEDAPVRHAADLSGIIGIPKDIIIASLLSLTEEASNTNATS